MPAMRMAFVDLETTGATAAVDRITEIGVVEVDDEGTREWSTLVNPQTHIPEFIQRLTGINNAMVVGAPSFVELAAGLRQRLDGCLFVAHNASFDYGFLKAEFARAGIDFRATVLCTVKLSRRLFPEHRKHNLDSLIERHGLRVEQRHRALGDAQAIAQFWQCVLRDVDAERREAVVKELTARPRLPPHLADEAIEALPAGPGVYLFYGENDQPLYVGRSKTLRKRVLAHFAADKPAELVQQVRRIDYIEVAGEVEVLLTEARMIRQLQPAMNPASKRNDDLANWPFAGPALLREGDALHVINAWCHLGTARSDTELYDVLTNGIPHFDRNVYQLLRKWISQMTPL